MGSALSSHFQRIQVLICKILSQNKTKKNKSAHLSKVMVCPGTKASIISSGMVTCRDLRSANRRRSAAEKGRGIAASALSSSVSRSKVEDFKEFRERGAPTKPKAGCKRVNPIKSDERESIIVGVLELWNNNVCQTEYFFVVITEVIRCNQWRMSQCQMPAEPTKDIRTEFS